MGFEVHANQTRVGKVGDSSACANYSQGDVLGEKRVAITETDAEAITCELVGL